MRARDKKGLLIPFSMNVCTYNKQSGKGGQLLIIESAILYEKAKQKISVAAKPDKRNIHHDLNSTKNLLLIPSNEIRTIHIRLIEIFNTKIVYD